MDKDWKLPFGIVKKPTGEGLTTYCILDQRMDTIIYCPTISLIDCKYQQHTLCDENSALRIDVQPVYQEITNQEIKDYIATHKRKKFLCTYDSILRLKRLIGAGWRDYHHVCDEWHLLIVWSSFKSDVMHRFLQTISEAPYRTFASATPIMPEILENTDYLKDLPITELEPERKRQFNIEYKNTAQPLEYAAGMIIQYRDGKFPMTKDGKESRQLVVFLNSVNEIVRLVHDCNLKVEDVCLIMGDNGDNHDAIRENLGEDFCIENDYQKQQKRFTFCTSIGFQGIDLYSDNALTLIVSDCKRQHTAISIDVFMP